MKKHSFLSILILIVVLVNSCTKKDKLFFTFLHTNPNKEELSKDSIASLQNAHFENITRLADMGIIVGAGPFEGGGGIFLIKMKSRDKVNDILMSDPAIAANRFIVETHPMKINYGAIYPVDTNYTMSNYDFLRIEGDIHDMEKILTLSNQTDSLKLICLFEFTDNKEKIMVWRDSSKAGLSRDFISGIIKKGEMKDRKTLWIARETFEAVTNN